MDIVVGAEGMFDFEEQFSAVETPDEEGHIQVQADAALAG